MPYPRPQRRSADLTRRRLLAAGSALGLAATLAACGGNDGSGGSTTAEAANAPWSFTDDRRQKVSAEHRPERVVAYIGTAAALHDFGVSDKIVGVFGPTRLKDGSPDPQAGALDVSKVTVLGNAFGEFNIEKYAALRPDLLVATMFEPGQLFYVPEESKEKISALAPSVGINVARVPLTGPIRRHAELAQSLGADLNSKKITDAKARFDKAAEAVRQAVRGNPGITVMAASGSPDLMYVSDPKVLADTGYFQQLGVRFVEPKKIEGGYFESLSWENADKYKADVILLDSRSSALQPKDLTGKPSWSELPAVKAGQVIPWLSEPRFSYEGCAPVLEALATAIGKAKKVT